MDMYVEVAWQRRLFDADNINPGGYKASPAGGSSPISRRFACSCLGSHA
jgi:hypothetical protein